MENIVHGSKNHNYSSFKQVQTKCKTTIRNNIHQYQRAKKKNPTQNTPCPMFSAYGLEMI